MASLERLLHDYVEALRAGDPEAVAGVFAPDARFHDEAPCAMGLPAISLEGRPAIRDSFRGVLAQGGLAIENVAVHGPAMRYDIVLGPDTTLRALGVARERDGRIGDYHVVAVA